jgi:multiple sugar transport system permease protein
VDGSVHTAYMLEMVMNSLVFCAINTFVNLIVTMCVAYVTARHNFWFNKVIVGFFYFQMLVPLVGSMSSSLKILKELHLFDTWIGFAIQRYNFFGGLSFLIYRDMFKKLADSYADAAKIDGAGNFQIMVQICFPLVKSIFMMGVMTGLISSWNNYSGPLVYLPSHPTISYGLYIFNNAKSGGDNAQFAYMPYKLAGFMLLLLPTTVFYLGFKERMLRASSTGGLKE